MLPTSPVPLLRKEPSTYSFFDDHVRRHAAWRNSASTIFQFCIEGEQASRKAGSASALCHYALGSAGVPVAV